MNVLSLVVLLVVVIAVGAWWTSRRGRTRAVALDDAKADARRWVERLGGQVLSLTGTNEASTQAIADAAERYTAAGSQMDQARSVAQARLVTETAYEGLYYVRAARTAMGLDPGPELPPLPGQNRAGSVTEDRDVQVDGHEYSASPAPSGVNRHYYPGGTVAGRPVPRGWYSEPWWRSALIGGAWGLGTALLVDSLFSGMHGIPYAHSWADGGWGGGWGGPDAMIDPGGDWGGGGTGDGGGGPGGGDRGGDFGGGDRGGDGSGGDWGGGGAGGDRGGDGSGGGGAGGFGDWGGGGGAGGFGDWGGGGAGDFGGGGGDFGGDGGTF